MRVNVYAEEMTDRLEIISKEIDGQSFTGLRFYLYLQVTHTIADSGGPVNVRGPFLHRAGDDDSAAVTFWGKRDLRKVLRQALAMLDVHYGNSDQAAEVWPAPQPVDEVELDRLFAAGGNQVIPVLAWYPRHALDDDTGDLTERVVGGDWVQTEWMGSASGWNEPGRLTECGSYFGDDWVWAQEPEFYLLLPPPPPGRAFELDKGDDAGSAPAR